MNNIAHFILCMALKSFHMAIGHIDNFCHVLIYPNIFEESSLENILKLQDILYINANILCILIISISQILIF